MTLRIAMLIGFISISFGIVFGWMYGLLFLGLLGLAMSVSPS